MTRAPSGTSFAFVCLHSVITLSKLRLSFILNCAVVGLGLLLCYPPSIGMPLVVSYISRFIYYITDRLVPNCIRHERPGESEFMLIAYPLFSNI